VELQVKSQILAPESDQCYYCMSYRTCPDMCMYLSSSSNYM